MQLVQAEMSSGRLLQRQTRVWSSRCLTLLLSANPQIVWASTTAVGCARVDGCAAGAGLGAGWVQALYVCRYSPPGNVQSVEEYMANVHPLAALQADSSG